MNQVKPTKERVDEIIRVDKQKQNEFNCTNQLNYEYNIEQNDKIYNYEDVDQVGVNEKDDDDIYEQKEPIAKTQTEEFYAMSDIEDAQDNFIP